MEDISPTLKRAEQGIVHVISIHAITIDFIHCLKVIIWILHQPKMFKVNEAMNGMGTLTVKDGKMTIHVSLASEHIVNLFVGTAEDAQKEGARLLNPTKDTVTYSDGTTEEVYGFDIPVQKLDEEFDLALVGTKGKWYDHKVSVSYPAAEQETEMMTEEATE